MTAGVDAADLFGMSRIVAHLSPKQKSWKHTDIMLLTYNPLNGGGTTDQCLQGDDQSMTDSEMWGTDDCETRKHVSLCC